MSRLKGQSPISPGKKTGSGERRVHRSVPLGGMPTPIVGSAAGITLGADTEILQKLVRQLRMERAFLETVLDQMPVGVVIAEAPSGRMILGNKRVDELLRERFFAAITIDQYDHWFAYRATGERYQPKEMPLSRALLFGDVVRGEAMRIRRGDRSYGLFEVSAAPVRDEKGLIVAGVVSFQEVSDRGWAQQMFHDFPSEKPRTRKR